MFKIHKYVLFSTKNLIQVTLLRSSLDKKLPFFHDGYTRQYVYWSISPNLIFLDEKDVNLLIIRHGVLLQLFDFLENEPFDS